MHDDLNPDIFNEHTPLDPDLAALDDFIGRALVEDSQAHLPAGLTRRILSASVPHLAAPPAPLRLAVEDDPGPSMLPAPGAPWWTPFVVIAAGLILAVGLTLRFGTQMINNKPGNTPIAADTTVDVDEIDDRFQRLNLALAASRTDTFDAEIALESLALESRFNNLHASILASSLTLNDPAAQLIDVTVDDAADYAAWIAAQLETY